MQPGKNGRRRDGGALARLRCCSSVIEVAGEPATMVLCRRLHAGAADFDRAALIAVVLADVREDRRDLPVARQIGVQTTGEAVMSALRFRRLLQAETWDERLTCFRRLVALSGGSLNVADLATGLWYWSDERRRRSWIQAYHGVSDTAAMSPTDATQQEHL